MGMKGGVIAASPRTQVHNPLQSAIGSGLENARCELISAGTELSGMLEAPGSDLTREALRLLEAQACRIAVVGQIKAGKSSFINALVQRPRLLPTSINPWTTAVTNLHFCQQAPGGDAAVFRFFSGAEWERLAEGGGKLRELTERLVPGFEPALLREQVASHKTRAAQRLGEQFNQLLGQAHAYHSLEDDTLEQYVCAGNAVSAGPAGRYSDITRSADIYLPSGPFAFPATITDTPGTNDPLLVRDEITRTSLDAADINLVVLTAHQPLSDADVSLLRVLRGLHKERIIVFINRIDELHDARNDGAEVVEFVRKRLAKELPGADIPIIAGSALWGLASYGSDAGPALDPASVERALAYCRDGDLLDRDEIFSSVPVGAMVQTLHRRALRAASGLDRIYAALDAMMPTSRCGYTIRQFSRCFVEMAQTTEGTLREAHASLARMHADEMLSLDRLRTEHQRVKQDQESLAKTREIVAQSAREFEHELHYTLRTDLDALRTRLTAIVDAHARDEAYSLVAVLNAGRTASVWTCDSASLRRELADSFMAAFHVTEAKLADVSLRMVAGLRHLTSLLSPASIPQPEPDVLRDMVSPPSLGALGTTVTLDLHTSWWEHLWNARPTIDERGETLEYLIKTVFHPVVDELIVSYRQTFEDYVGMSAQWSFAVGNNILQALTVRHDQMSAYCASVEDRLAGHERPAATTQLSQQSYVLQQRVAHASGVSHRLLALQQIVDGWFARPVTSAQQRP